MANLTGGNVTINGDVDGDGQPDITLTTSQSPGGAGVTVYSAGNTLYALALQNFGYGVWISPPRLMVPVTGATFSHTTVSNLVLTGVQFTGIGVNPPSSSSADNQSNWDHILITGNTISGNTAVLGIAVGLDSRAGGGTLQHTTIANNNIVLPMPGAATMGIVFGVGNGVGAMNNQALDTLIANNTISVAAGTTAIRIAAGGGSGSANLMDGVQVIANQIGVVGQTASANGLAAGIDLVVGDGASDDVNVDPSLRPIQYAENNIVRNIAILSNTIGEAGSFGISAQAACCGNGNNTIDNLSILGNTLTGMTLGAGASADYYSRPSTGNMLSNVLVQANTIHSSPLPPPPPSPSPPTLADTIPQGGGIFVIAGLNAQGNSVNGISIANNDVNTQLIGINMIGGWSAPQPPPAVGFSADNNVVAAAQIFCNQIDQAATAAPGGNYPQGVGSINVAAGITNANGNQVRQLYIADNLVAGVLAKPSLFPYLGGGGSGNAISISPNSPPTTCTYALNLGGQGFPASGGTGTVTVTTSPGCLWRVDGVPAGVTLTSAAFGTGSGTVTFVVPPNSGGDLVDPFVIGGQSYTIEQQSASIPGLGFIGSMPHIAAEENWTTTFTLLNHASSSNQARLSLFGSSADATGSGNPLPLPLTFPQAPGLGPLLGASIDHTLPPFASWIVGTAVQAAPISLTGSAQVLATGDLGGFAIFHRNTDNQEAVVPLTPGTPNAPAYLLSFDNTGGIVTAVAVANVSPQAASIGYIIRNDQGGQIANGALALQASGQTSFALPDPVNGFPATAGIRGTVEFDAPSGGQISVLGIRNTPQVTASGAVTTLTTVPALANAGTGGGSFAFLASGGDGWQTTFVLINAGNSPATGTLRFLDPNGAPLPLPISYPQLGGTVSTTASITPTLAAGATLIVQSNGAPSLLTGSAQLTTTGSVSGFVIFRHNGQEAVVPMESRNAPVYVLAFDNTNGTATGIAINNVSGAAQQVSIPVVVRDDGGNQLVPDTLNMPANGGLAFTLVTDKYPQTANLRGTIEFDAPIGVQIGVIGIRTPAALTYTSLPALVK